MLHIARMCSKCLEGKIKLSQKIQVIYKAIAAIQGVLAALSLKDEKTGSWFLLNEGQSVSDICSTPKASEFC